MERQYAAVDTLAVAVGIGASSSCYTAGWLFGVDCSQRF